MKRIAAVLCVLSLVCVPVALAEPVEPTPQALGSGADFLLRATAPSAPAAICVVDTGINANPDTTNVIARSSIQGLDGLDRSPTLHGTRLAMLLGASKNDWGTVGFWPSVPIVSVQANEPDADRFETGGYLRGMHDCNELSRVHPIKVTLVSVASESPLSPIDAESLEGVLAQARVLGINVVVAAGNLDGRPVGTPANVAGALSVGAADASSGARCPSSASGALFFAPGCSIVSADPTTGQTINSQEGTSAAAAFLAAGIAALRTWRPDLPALDVERILSESATSSPVGRHLNLAATFAAVGWRNITLPPAASPPPPATPVVKARLAKPRVSVRLKRRVLTIRATNRPAGTRMVVRVYVRNNKGNYRKVAAQTRATTTIKFRLNRWSRLTVRFSDPKNAKSDSEVTKVTRRR